MSETKDLQVLQTSLTFQEVEKLAQAMAKSRLFPSAQTLENALALMLLCQSEGIHPAQAVRRFHVINGTVAMRADAMLAEFQARGGKVQWIHSDATMAKASFEHPQGGKLEFAYHIDEAKAAGLVRPGSGWSKFPSAMLRARCISGAIRMVLPGIVCGVYTPEEVLDFDADKKPAPAKKSPAQEKVQEAEIVTEVVIEKVEAPKVDPTPEPVNAPAAPSSAVEPLPITASVQPTQSSDVNGKQVAEQLKAIRDLSMKNGMKTPDEIRELVAAIIKHDIVSAHDLTHDERTFTILELQKMLQTETKEVAA